MLYSGIDFSKPIEVVEMLYLKNIEPHRSRFVGEDGIYYRKLDVYTINNSDDGRKEITKEEFYEASEKVVKYVKLKAFEFNAENPHMTMFRIENNALYESDNRINL